MFEKLPKRIIYAYGEYNQIFEQMESRIPGLILHQGLPTKEQITEWTDPTEHTLIVLDDLMSQVTKSEDALFLFTVTAHHIFTSVLYLCQNIFNPGKYARTISLKARGTQLRRAINNVCCEGRNVMNKTQRLHGGGSGLRLNDGFDVKLEIVG